MGNHSLLLLSMADPATDRRAQNFKRFFEEAGWNVELLSVQTKAERGPRRFQEYDRNLTRAVMARGADVVMACDLFSLAAARSMKRGDRTKFLIYDAREVYTELPNVAKKPMAKWIWRRLERRGLMAADIVVVTAPRDAQAICDVHDFLPRPTLVRNLPWREEHIPRDRSKLSRFGIPEQALVAAYIGGVQEGRGLKQLLQVFRRLEDQYLLIIGDGVGKAALENNSPTNVHFAGAVPAAEAMGIITSCDIGISLIEPISPSYVLALPSKIFEYMMCGIPVVSSRLEQVLDLFEKEEWIRFADVTDLNSIRNAMEAAFALARNDAIKERERMLAVTEYHFEHDAARLLDLIQKLSP